jgi:hypothetical protein
MASFNSTAAISAMNSKWCAKKNCAVQIQMSAEAAAELNFGNSPFVLKEGEDKASRQKKDKGVIQRGNTRPDELGGMDADDLQSVGDESNADTIFISDEDEEEYEDYEDDDVSVMSDNEGFEGDGDESTIQQESGSDEEEDEDMEDAAEDDDSAFSTKVGLDDLATSGRKVRGDGAEELKLREEQVEAEAAALEMEKSEARQKMAAQAKEMEDIMARLRFKEEALNAALRNADVTTNNAATPGATGEEAQGVQSSQDATASSASAVIK